MRRIAHFSCGAASAVAAKLSEPDEIWYAETGSEDRDNERFLYDCETWFGQKVKRLRSEKYRDTWEVWGKKRFLSGPYGAPCTAELKVLPLRSAAHPDDVNIIGYTADPRDARRAKLLQAKDPDYKLSFPLIERGLIKSNCLAILEAEGIKPPRVYKMGFHNANCMPCCKASSPKYWALVRKHFPDEFEKMDQLCRELGATPVQFSNKKISGKYVKKRGFPSDVPFGQFTNDPISPACDLLCALETEGLMDIEY